MAEHELSLLDQLREDWVAHGRHQAWSKPGFQALAAYRFGAWASRKREPERTVLLTLYRLLYYYARNYYGIDLHYRTRVGRRLVMNHHGGIVIHADAQIGNDCVIRQNVTIGATSFEAIDQAPRLGNRVELGPGATVLGKVTVGDDVRIGPNAVVMTNVPSGARVFATPARIMAPAQAELSEAEAKQ